MAPQILWMLELASQRGFRERTRHRVCGLANSGNADGAGCFDSLGRNAGLAERSEPPPGTESVPGSSESKEIGHAKWVSARARGIPAVEEGSWCCGKLTTH
jgi:hypothetical protein